MDFTDTEKLIKRTQLRELNEIIRPNDDPYSAFNEKKRELMDDLGFD